MQGSVKVAEYARIRILTNGYRQLETRTRMFMYVHRHAFGLVSQVGEDDGKHAWKTMSKVLFVISGMSCNNIRYYFLWSHAYILIISLCECIFVFFLLVKGLMFTICSLSLLFPYKFTLHKGRLSLSQIVIL